MCPAKHARIQYPLITRLTNLGKGGSNEQPSEGMDRRSGDMTRWLGGLMAWIRLSDCLRLQWSSPVLWDSTHIQKYQDMPETALQEFDQYRGTSWSRLFVFLERIVIDLALAMLAWALLQDEMETSQCNRTRKRYPECPSGYVKQQI